MKLVFVLAMCVAVAALMDERPGRYSASLKTRKFGKSHSHHHRAAPRFKAKVNSTENADDQDADAKKDTKLHITPIKSRDLNLVQKTTAKHTDNMVVDVQAAYTSGLADQSQSTSTIDDEMTNQMKQISEMISDETKRATKAEDDIKTAFTDEIQKNSQTRLNAEKDLDAAISKETNERKEADDTRAKSENDVTKSLNDQLSDLNDKVSQCSQNVQKATQKANSLEAIVNAYTDKKGGGTKIAFISQYEHVQNLHHLHERYEKMAAKFGF
jgi:hypothetical protein